MRVTKDFEDLFACFHRHQVRALIVGGYAVAFHAKPRYTKDIDVLIDPTEDNARRILAALAEFGFGDVGLEVEDLTKLGQIIQLGVAPNRVDLLTSVGDFRFEEAWEARVDGAYGSQSVFYVGKSHLIRSKRVAGRPQDLIDLEWLQAD